MVKRGMEDNLPREKETVTETGLNAPPSHQHPRREEEGTRT